MMRSMFFLSIDMAEGAIRTGKYHYTVAFVLLLLQSDCTNQITKAMQAAMPPYAHHKQGFSEEIGNKMARQDYRFCSD